MNRINDCIFSLVFLEVMLKLMEVYLGNSSGNIGLEEDKNKYS
jgi:hypothetical protein